MHKSRTGKGKPTHHKTATGLHSIRLANSFFGYSDVIMYFATSIKTDTTTNG